MRSSWKQKIKYNSFPFSLCKCHSIWNYISLIKVLNINQERRVKALLPDLLKRVNVYIDLKDDLEWIIDDSFLCKDTNKVKKKKKNRKLKKRKKEKEENIKLKKKKKKKKKKKSFIPTKISPHL